MLVSLPYPDVSAQTFTSGQYEIGFDAVTGAVTTFAVNGFAWAGPQNPLGQFVYRMYNQTDILNFLGASGALNDYHRFRSD